MDDLGSIGTGLNLASGSDFSNPLLARQGFPGALFSLFPAAFPCHRQLVEDFWGQHGLPAGLPDGHVCPDLPGHERWSLQRQPQWTYVFYAKECLKDKLRN